MKFDCDKDKGPDVTTMKSGELNWDMLSIIITLYRSEICN